MRLSTLLSVFVLNFLSLSSFGQNNYWTESFENTNIPGNTAGVFTTPTDVNLPTSGVWKMYFLYRGSTGSCDGKPLRFLNTTTAGLSGAAYAITPALNSGVGQLFFVENSGSPRTIAIYKSTDNGVTFSLLRNVTTMGLPCDTTLITINDGAINRLKFANETTSNSGLDNMKISKNGTLLDGSGGGGGGGPIDTAAWYPDTSRLVPAFPGAEGAGKYTRGGRGGVVVEVTNLEDDAAGNIVGSFRWAQRQNTGPKTIVFRVSGTIHLKESLSLARGDVTIAGQTAPGDGITIADFPVTIGKKNVIIRHIRFRLGDIGIQRTGYASSAGDAVNSSGGANADSIIIDHCTSSWSIDEAATFKNMTHFTMQNCLISEPLNQSEHSGELHGYGGIWGGVNASFHHNLFAHCSSRNCRFNGSRQYDAGEKDTVDYRNNVIYDWGINTVNGGEGGYYNVVNNYYKPGPSTNATVLSRTLNPYKDGSLPYGKFYMAGNIMTSSSAVTENNWLGARMEDGATPLADTGLSKLDRQVKVYRTNTHTAQAAYDYVLANAGATLPRRDTLDQRIVNDVKNGTGRIIDVQGGFPAFTDTALTTGAWPVMLSRAAPVDNDHDGMADEWELQRGLNPANAADRNGVSLNGYTNLENYLNGDSIVAFGKLNTCVTVPSVDVSSSAWTEVKDTSYVRLISTDTTNLVAALKQDAGNGRFAVSFFVTANNRTFNNKVYLNRNITITQITPGVGTSLLVRLYFTKAEFDQLKQANAAITGLGDLRVLRTADNCPTTLAGNVTEIIPTSYGLYGTYANGYFVEFTSPQAGTFFIGSGTGALPATLLSFKARYTGKSVVSDWVTASEKNVQSFNLERSSDAQRFETLTNIAARNGANQSYSYVDPQPLNGKSYYRVRMNDLDGSSKYSNIANIEIAPGNGLSIYPNPVTATLTAHHPAGDGGTIELVTKDGKRISTKAIVDGANLTVLNVGRLAPGTYNLIFKNADNRLVQQFVKQ